MEWKAFILTARLISPSPATAVTILLSGLPINVKVYGDGYELVNLLEVCKDSLCVEPRDKVYGLLGIAHDCQDGSLLNDY